MHMRFGRPALLSGLLLLAMFVSSVGMASADSGSGKGKNGPVNAWFSGTATTGIGAQLPVEIEPWNIRMRSDGAIGLGYKYLARGEASGQVQGSFVYEEHGYLFFMNPANPATYVGSTFVSGVFVLTPRRGGGPVVLADTDPAAYTSGVIALSNKPPKGALQALRIIYGGPTMGKMMKSGNLVYGTFSFTNNYGTHVGYASPDFRQFAIQIVFDCPGCK